MHVRDLLSGGTTLATFSVPVRRGAHLCGYPRIHEQRGQGEQQDQRAGRQGQGDRRQGHRQPRPGGRGQGRPDEEQRQAGRREGQGRLQVGLQHSGASARPVRRDTRGTGQRPGGTRRRGYARRRRTTQTAAPTMITAAATTSASTSVLVPESSSAACSAASVLTSVGVPVAVGELDSALGAVAPGGAGATLSTGAGRSGLGRSAVTGSIQASSRPSEYRCRVGKTSSVASAGNWATVTLYSASSPGASAGPPSSKPSAVGVSTQPSGPPASDTSAGTMPSGSWVFTLTTPKLGDSDSAMKDSVTGPVPAWAPSAETSTWAAAGPAVMRRRPAAEAATTGPRTWEGFKKE